MFFFFCYSSEELSDDLNEGDPTHKNMETKDSISRPNRIPGKERPLHFSTAQGIHLGILRQVGGILYRLLFLICYHRAAFRGESRDFRFDDTTRFSRGCMRRGGDWRNFDFVTRAIKGKAICRPVRIRDYDLEETGVINTQQRSTMVGATTLR